MAILPQHIAIAINVQKSDAPLVYIDCEWCDMDFIKTEIPFVNYVIDRTDADIYILITTQVTAGGGMEWTINFIGQHNYQNMNDTLIFTSNRLDTEDLIRRGIVRRLKLGLARYLAKTSLADDITISLVKQPVPKVTADRWNNWVFTIDIRSYLNGEQSKNFNSIYSSFSANRTTKDWKTNLSAYYNYHKSSFKMDDTIISSDSKSYGLSGAISKGINDHWSIGNWVAGYSSTYNNKKIGFTIWPSVEYNIFPYSQSTSKEFRTSYRAGYAYHQYYEETIYDKLEEILFYEAMSVTLDTKQRWGSISTTLEGFHYFHDFSKNRLSLFSNLSLPIVRGLSLSLFGQIRMLHDQISLRKKGLTPEEVLLQIKQQATQYDYFISIGLSYSFGSLFSNVVNPRFGE